MWPDLQEPVADVMARAMPIVDFRMLNSDSIRNSLLAHYLIEYLGADKIRGTLIRDPSYHCMEKLAVADEYARYTGQSLIYVTMKADYPATVIDRIVHEDEYDPRKPRDSPSLLKCTSKVNKFATVLGLRMYGAIFDSPAMEAPDEEGNGELGPRLVDAVRPPLDEGQWNDPMFELVSEGADTMHAAACYLQLFDRLPNGDRFKPRIAAAQTPADLRRVIGFKVYAERIVSEGMLQASWDAFEDLDKPTDEMYLETVVNWNRCNIERTYAGMMRRRVKTFGS